MVKSILTSGHTVNGSIVFARWRQCAPHQVSHYQHLQSTVLPPCWVTLGQLLLAESLKVYHPGRTPCPQNCPVSDIATFVLKKEVKLQPTSKLPIMCGDNYMLSGQWAINYSNSAQWMSAVKSSYANDINFKKTTAAAAAAAAATATTTTTTVLWCFWLDGRKGIWPEWWGNGVVICLERGANDLHMVQLMPLTTHHLLLQ